MGCRKIITSQIIISIILQNNSTCKFYWKKKNASVIDKIEDLLCLVSTLPMSTIPEHIDIFDTGIYLLF